MNFSRNNNNKEDKKVVKDAPIMRSVAVRSTSYPSPTLTAARPSSGLSATTRFLDKVPPTLPLKSGNIIIKDNYKSDNKSASAGTWTVMEHCVKQLPQMYPLERTNVTVLTATAQQVMDRIAECMRQQSIAATFDADKAAVQAETRDHVRFIVQLFFNDTKTVIVEAQRRCGCSYVFHQCADAVLNAALGIPPRPAINLPKFTIPDCVKEAAAAAAAADEDCKEEQAAVESDLEYALQLWKNDRYDAQLLGIESLVLLSEQKNYGAFCAHSLLCSKCVQEMLLDLVFQTNEVDDCDTMVAEHSKLMRHYALTVLANCLEALGESGELPHVLEKNETLRSPTLVDTLVAALTTAEQDPHDAHEAARCLGPLCKFSMICKEQALDMGAPEAVTRALDVGMIRHALLEGASRRLQSEMGFSFS